MKIAFVVNKIATEEADYTTTYLALAARRREHQVWYVDVSGFVFAADGTVLAHALAPEAFSHETTSAFLADVRSNSTEQIIVDNLDVLMLRNDPAEDVVNRPWARIAPLFFGREAAIRGVIVLNDPDGLTHAINKSYLEFLPPSVRPKTIITRSRQDIVSFVKSIDTPFVIKPLTGSGGHNVFLVQDIDEPDFEDIVEAVMEEGYAMVQEYVEGAHKGDVRLFLLNGRPLTHDGKFAAIARVPPEADFRSNMSIGGKAMPAVVTSDMLAIVEQVSPQLVADGLFLVGLDIIGNKLLEVNVFSPGGLHGASRIAGVDFSDLVVEALEKKVHVAEQEPGLYTNREIAVI